MNDQTDSQLLGAWAERRSEPAFAELVRRHVDLVYSATLRTVCDSHLAKDVTQSVFVALAKDAARITDRQVLSGWLHRTAQNIAAQTVRTDVRRRAREQEAVVMNQLLATEPDAAWEYIAPHLDAALGELSEPDRDAVLLRYFENKSLREVGQALGMSDDTAQKRVSRAVERLREFFAKRGVTVGASGLVVVITANAVQAAPVGLAATISTAAALAGTTLATTATLATHTTMNWINIKSISAIVAAALAAGTATHLVEQRGANRLHAENQSLLAQQNQLTSERDAAVSAAAQKNDELTQSLKGKDELLRLRGEVGVLRRQTSDLARLTVENRQLRTQALSVKGTASIQEPRTQSSVAELNACINNLRQIDGAMQMCGLENRLTSNDWVTAEQILPYFRNKELPRCPSGGTYAFAYLTNAPTCSIAGHALNSSAPPSETPPTDVQVTTKTTSAPPANQTDLGLIEFSDGIAVRFDLGGGTNCLVTPKALADGNAEMKIRVEVTNADGTTSLLGESDLIARPGQQCAISVGDRMIGLTPKPKTQ